MEGAEAEGTAKSDGSVGKKREEGERGGGRRSG